MSDAVSKRRKPLRAHLISPVPLAAGLGLLSAGLDNAAAVQPPGFSFNMPIASGSQYQYALVPGTEAPGSVLANPGETLLYPAPGTPFVAPNGTAEFTAGGNLLYNLTSCPAPGSIYSRVYSTNLSNGIAQITFVAPAVDDNYFSLAGTGISFDVENNDILPFHGNLVSELSLSGFTAPTHGSLTHGANGQFQYVPNPGFVGTDTFTYTLNTGLDCSNVRSLTSLIPAHSVNAIQPVHTIQANPQAGPSDPATALVTIQVRAPAASAPANTVVGLGFLATLLAWFGLRRRRDT